MAKYLLALSIAFALLLAGCAGIAGNPYNGGSGKGSRQNGTALVTVQDVVSGCGIAPPDGNYSACGVHSSTPRAGKFNVSVYSLSFVSPNNSTHVISVYTAESTRTSGPILETIVETNSNGEFSLDLPPGDYGFMIYGARDGLASERFSVAAGKTTSVGINFTISVPQARQP